MSRIHSRQKQNENNSTKVLFSRVINVLRNILNPKHKVPGREILEALILQGR